MARLGLSIRYSLFSLSPQLIRSTSARKSFGPECDRRHRTSTDVLISLYNFKKFRTVLQRSVQSCFNNQNVTYHFVLVSGDEEEETWLKALIGSSHHNLYLVEDRVGIYEAWNLAIRSGTGNFITNLNVDDLRIPHSICSQAADLQDTESDGTYGNFEFSTDIFKSLERSESNPVVSSLGEFNKDILVEKSQNFMHCAPMWKRELHSRHGFFDESLKSSGDTEFWLRAMSKGATFTCFSPVTAVYFHNPDGLSTTIASSGRYEWSRIRDNYLKTNS